MPPPKKTCARYYEALWSKKVGEIAAHTGALNSGFANHICVRLGVERELEASWPVGFQSIFALMVISDMVFASLCGRCVPGFPE